MAHEQDKIHTVDVTADEKDEVTAIRVKGAEKDDAPSPAPQWLAIKGDVYRGKPWKLHLIGNPKSQYWYDKICKEHGGPPEQLTMEQLKLEWVDYEKTQRSRSAREQQRAVRAAALSGSRAQRMESSSAE